MTTFKAVVMAFNLIVVEAYRLDRYDNIACCCNHTTGEVVEAYRLDRYDNFRVSP